jgi:dienelactone hydrolase
MERIGRLVLALVLGLGAAERVAAAERLEPVKPTHGEVVFRPTADEAQIAELFRLTEHRFEYELRPVESYATTMDIARLTFPSPVQTAEPNNNTVHCEYFRPRRPGSCPGVVVLHILGGDFDLARLFARFFADRGVAALFLKMPYYGERRQPGSSKRMVSEDIEATVAGLRQAVLDVRQATAWLASRDEIDADRLGVFGISLGGITAGLSATAEPRLSRVCLMLAGGDIGQVAWESPELEPLRRRWAADGGSKEDFFATLAKVDPVTYAHNAHGRKILLINAQHDEVIPRACTESLWRALGEPEIEWLDAGHYSAMRYIFNGLGRVSRFFAQP